jgi:hypothetical protein
MAILFMYPFADMFFEPSTAREVVIDVIKAFSPRIVHHFDVNRFQTEATPEVGIAMTPFSATINLLFELLGI